MWAARVRFWLCVAFSVPIVASLSADRVSYRPQPRLSLTVCTVGGMAARCGSLLVPENRAGSHGRMIALRVAVVPARGTARQPDPVFWLAGGPGVAATDDLSSAALWLWAVNLSRDLVFIDQRGTGASNDLRCPQGSEPDAWADELRACLSGLPADPTAYTTAWAMDDADDVRAALGYPTVNLYGGSYGATAAQVYLQRHPTRVRSVVLLGGTLLEVPIFERMPANSQRAMDLLIARCASDAACHAAYPDPAADLRAVIARLDRGQVDLPITDPATGQPARFTREALGPGLHSLLRDPRTAALVPKVLHSAGRGDWASVLDTVPDEEEATSEPTWQLMNLTIMCHEPWARLGAAETAATSAGSYLSYDDVRALTVPESICAAVPPPDPSAIYAAPVPVQVPMMFINGDADPQDPPANVASAGRTYPASVALTAVAESHSFANPDCLADVIDAFVDRASTQGLPAACLARPSAVAFAADRSGGR